MNKAQAAALAQFAPGDRVTIKAVAFPELAHHAVYIGKTGTVRKIIKSRRVVVIVGDTHAFIREFYPENIAKAGGR